MERTLQRLMTWLLSVSHMHDTMQSKNEACVCFVAFHIKFRYLYAVGYLIAGSGARYALEECGLEGFTQCFPVRETLQSCETNTC